MAIYAVTRANAPKDEKPRMVEARMGSQAISHVVGTMFSAKAVTTKDAIALSKEGVELETAGEEAGGAE